MTGSASDAAGSTALNQMPGQLMGATEKCVGSGADAEPFFGGPLSEIPALFDGQHEGFFRINMLARIEHLGRDRVMHCRYREVDDHID